MLHDHNNFVQGFVTAMEHQPSEKYHVIIRVDRIPAGHHMHRYNKPITHEVAIILVDAKQGRKDIILCKRDDTGHFSSLSQTPTEPTMVFSTH